MAHFVSEFFCKRLFPVLFMAALISGAAGAAPGPQAGTPASPQPISITSMNPKVSAAIPAGGISFPTEVTITGRGFLPGAQVMIGKESASIVSVAPTEIHITVPGQPAGVVDVTVTNPSGSSTTQPKFFTYTTGPVIYAISPQTGSASAPTEVHITGGNFSVDSVVTFGGMQAEIQSFFSATSLDVQVPANAGAGKTAVEVIVKNPDGQSFALPNGFTWTSSAPASSAPSPAPTSKNSAGADACGGL